MIIVYRHFGQMMAYRVELQHFNYEMTVPSAYLA